MASNGTPQSYLYNQRPQNNVEDKSMQQYYTDSGNPYGYVPQNYGNVSQPQSYDPSFQPAVQNRYIPPTLQGAGSNPTMWNNQGLSYQLPAGYGPYSNNGYQLPYFNQNPYSQNGNPYSQLPAYQQQQMNPYMPQFNGQLPVVSNPYQGWQNGGLQGQVQQMQAYSAGLQKPASGAVQAGTPSGANGGYQASTAAGYGQQQYPQQGGFNPQFSNWRQSRDGNDFRHRVYQQQQPQQTQPQAAPVPQFTAGSFGLGPLSEGTQYNQPITANIPATATTIAQSIPSFANGPMTMQPPNQHSIQPIYPTVTSGAY